MGIYNEYPLGVNDMDFAHPGSVVFGNTVFDAADFVFPNLIPNTVAAVMPGPPRVRRPTLHGMDDWFLSYGSGANVSRAASFPQHIGELGEETGVYKVHTSEELKFFGIPAWAYILGGISIYMVSKKK